MTKQQFLDMLKKRWSVLPKQELTERLIFYSEMIDDRIEEGFSEEEAVASVGTVDEIVVQTLTENSYNEPLKEKKKPKKQLKSWQTVLFWVGSPIWFSLAVAGLAVVFSLAVAGLAVAFSLYLVTWAVIVSFWAVFGAMIGCAFAGVVSAIILTCTGAPMTGVVMLAAGLVCGGLSVFLFYGCKGALQSAIWLTKKIPSWLKNGFKKKEKV